MQDMIFGIGLNPSRYDEDEIFFKVSPYYVYITDKKTWGEHQCCNDMINQEAYSLLNSIGFHEDRDGLFLCDNHQDSKDMIIASLVLHGFVHNEDFEEFMIDAEE